jgi:hypothetical protein
VLVFGEEFRAAFPKGHRFAASHLHLAHEKDPDADQKQHRKPIEQEHHVPRRLVFGLRGDLDFPIAQRFDQFRIVGSKSSKALAALILALNVLALDYYLLDFSPFHRAHELAEDDLRLTAMLLAKNAEDNQKNQKKN